MLPIPPAQRGASIPREGQDKENLIALDPRAAACEARAHRAWPWNHAMPRVTVRRQSVGRPKATMPA